jgi:signal transduction histidine kinase
MFLHELPQRQGTWVIDKFAAFVRRHPWAFDLALAVTFLLADLKEMSFFHSILGPMGEIAAWGVVLAILVLRAGLMTFRRRFPVAVALVLSATFITIPLNGIEYIFTAGASPPNAGGPGWWPTVISYTSMLEILVCVYTVTALRGTQSGMIVGAWFNLCALPWAIPQVIIGGPFAPLFFVVCTGIAVYLGTVRRRFLAVLAAIAERNRRIDDGRQRAATDAARSERERVSTELQALVSRNLERMLDEATRARETIEGHSGAPGARDAIQAIERTGRMALDDARRALGLLRDDDESAPLAPAPSLRSRQYVAPPDASVSRETSRSLAPATGRTPDNAAFAFVVVVMLISEIGFSRSPNVWPHTTLSLIAHPADITAIILLTCPVAFRHRSPFVAALAAALGFGLLGWAGHFFGLSSFVALLIALYGVWADRGIMLGLVALSASSLSIVSAAAELSATFRFGLTTAYLPFLSGACLLGLQEHRLQRARSRLEDQESDLRQLAELDLERARREERVRIARELHDVTAHSLSVMVIQAGAARTVAAVEPEKARRALVAVEEIGRRAQTDLAHLFSAVALNGSINVESMPSLSSLPALANQMRAAGLEVELQTASELGSLSPGLDLSLYRVVQEALTNVAKHAGATRVRVRLAFEKGRILLEIEDEGPSTDQPATPPAIVGGGRGLLGMRERIRAFGGSLDATRRGEGFAVRVQVPLATNAMTSPN